MEESFLSKRVLIAVLMKRMWTRMSILFVSPSRKYLSNIR